MRRDTKILVVDDDTDLRNDLATILRDADYIVDLVANGQEAIRKTESAVYNIALIDIRLPDMDGIELLTRLSDTVPKIRKILITGFPSMQNAIEAVNKKADAYILKPLEVDELLDTIREQLKLQENEKKYSEAKVAEFIETRAKEMCRNQS